MNTKFCGHWMLLTAVLLTACGGGGGGGGGGSSPVSGGGTSISGIAAIGAPMSGAAITLIDKNGTTAATTTADVNGAYSFSNINASSNPPPYVITAFGQTGDTQETLVSIKPDGSSGTVNITPLTHAIAANLSSNGDPLRLVSNAASESANITAVKVNAAEAAYRAALTNLISSLGASGNLISGNLGSAQDKLLDNVKVQVLPNGQINISSSGGTQADDVANNTALPAATQTVSLSQGQLPSASNASSLPSVTAPIGVQDLESARVALENCFKVPSTSRGTVAAPHASCLNLAAADYLHDGRNGVAEFNPFLTDPVYDNATLFKPEIVRYLTNSKVLVNITYRRTDGVVGSLQTVAEKFAGGWMLRGNQREFLTRVQGVISRREVLSNSAASRYETGIEMYVPTNANISKVVVTGPGLPGFVDDSNRGTGITLQAKSGCDFLAIVRSLDNTTPNCSDYFRVRSRTFAGADFVPSSTYLYRSPYLTDAEISNITPGSLYRFEITKTNATVVTYWNRLLSRPYTVAEIAAVPWIDLDSATRSRLASGAPTTAAAKVTIAWVRPSTAAPAYGIQVFHSQGNDRNVVSFSASSGVVSCSGNTFCDTLGNYSVNSLNVAGTTMYQVASRNRFGTVKFAQFVQ